MELAIRSRNIHEIAIMQALLEQLRSFVPENSVLREVCVEIGRLEHLDADVMQTAWVALTKESDLAGAVLSLVYTPILVRCQTCGNEYEPAEGLLFMCPECGAARPELKQGSGVVLRSVDVDELTT